MHLLSQVMMTFNGEKEETKRNFVRDLREVMAEVRHWLAAHLLYGGGCDSFVVMIDV